MAQSPQKETLAQSSHTVDLDQWCVAANDDSVKCFLKTTLQSMISDNCRELHIEQEKDFCRVRMRINGQLTERRVSNPALASELLHTISQENRSIDFKTSANDDFGELNVPVQIDGKKCELNIWHYKTVVGKCLTLSVAVASVIPEVLEQTRLDNKTKQQMRRLYSSTTTTGITLICSQSDDLLRSVFYALLGEVNRVERKVVTLQRSMDKHIPRINQILTDSNAAYPLQTDSTEPTAVHHPLVATATKLSDYTFVDWINTRDKSIMNALHANAQMTLFWHGTVDTGLLELFSSQSFAFNLKTIIELNDTGLICPHCADTYKPNRLDFKRLPESLSDTPSESYFFANGCSRCNDTGVSALATVASICQGTDAIREAAKRQSLGDAGRAVAEAQGSSSISAQLQKLAKTGKISFEDWINQQ